MPHRLQHRLQRTVTAALAAVLLILSGVGVVAFAGMQRLVDTAAAVDRTHRMLRALEATYSRVADAEAGSRGYVLTADSAYLEPYRVASASIGSDLGALRALAAERPRVHARLDELEPLVARRLAVTREAIRLRDAEGLAAALALTRSGRGKALSDSIRAVIDQLERDEEAVLAARSRGERAAVRRVTVAIAAGLALTLAVTVLAPGIVRRDLASRAAAERALRDAKEAAESASRAKSDFLARMSHELRTPLNSIIGFSNVLLRGRGAAFGDDGRVYLERVRDNGMHLLLMIDDLLDVSRIEAGRIAITREAVTLDALVRDVVGSFEEDARQRGLALRCELPDGPLRLDTDPARLRQVLVNLVGNALKFTERGSVTVRVAVDAASGAPAHLEVVDTGIGIPLERQAAVFDAFEQADTGTARRYGGTGLGLAISRSLCELLDYGLELESAPGRGSTFRVVFGGADRQPAPASDRRTTPVA